MEERQLNKGSGDTQQSEPRAAFTPERDRVAADRVAFVVGTAVHHPSAAERAMQPQLEFSGGASAGAIPK
jgi:hypothetical protein